MLLTLVFYKNGSFLLRYWSVNARVSQHHEYSISQRKEALECMYDNHNLWLWNIIYGNLQDERHAEEVITHVFKDVWKCDQVLFTKDRQLIALLHLCRSRLSNE
jgi:hypothetical protein